MKFITFDFYKKLVYSLVKYPVQSLTACLIIILIVLGFVYYEQNINLNENSDTRIKECKEDVLLLKAELKEARAEIKTLQILILRMSDEQIRELKDIRDSTTQKLKQLKK
jgi:hypothetical protein